MIKEKIQHYIPQNIDVEYFDNTALFEVPLSDIESTIGKMNEDKDLSFKLMTATDERKENGCFKIWYVFGVEKSDAVLVPFIRLKNTKEFPSSAMRIHTVLDYERRIKTFFGLTPSGHPDLRPIILHENWPDTIFPLHKDFDGQTKPRSATGNYTFNKVEGEGIYEIPVGPIHAGIIEPGHFRFSVAGEQIVLLEPRLGFTHKGSEKLFETLSLSDSVRLSEKISGDSSFSHSLAFCQAVEQLSGSKVPDRARYLRTIYAEMERLVNHLGDLGAIMTDAGFNFGGSQGTQLREIMMRVNEQLTGSRFLRSVNMIGGVAHDITEEGKTVLSTALQRIRKNFAEAMTIAENSTSLLNRLRGTGVLSPAIAKDYGIVGVAGKASGIAGDARFDHPYAAYNDLALGEVIVEQQGDVYARFHVRVKEVYASLNILQEALQKLPDGSIHASGRTIKLAKNALAVSMVEGWRGEIVYFVRTNADGRISRVFPRDPSMVNWAALAQAGFNNVVPDFPLINKSFNLSYSGNDL